MAVDYPIRVQGGFINAVATSIEIKDCTFDKSKSQYAAFVLVYSFVGSIKVQIEMCFFKNAVSYNGGAI